MDTMADPNVFLEKESGIATITISNPKKKNAFTFEMIDQWTAALETSRDDSQINVIVLRGDGEDFCSGVDFSSFGVEDRPGPFEMKNLLWERVHRVPRILEDIDKPIIAAMKGVAVGAGLDMALICDLRFAADTARFSEGYIKAGLVPGDGGAYYLPRLVGLAKALELLWTGDFIDAEEALRIGMVNRVYPSNILIEQTYQFAQRLSDGPGAVIRMIKRATYQSIRVDLKTALDLISSHMGVIRESPDSQKAFLAITKRVKSH
jgi:enoyl-CoA hydratase/carnithine racemase